MNFDWVNYMLNRGMEIYSSFSKSVKLFFSPLSFYKDLKVFKFLLKYFSYYKESLKITFNDNLSCAFDIKNSSESDPRPSLQLIGSCTAVNLFIVIFSISFILFIGNKCNLLLSIVPLFFLSVSVYAIIVLNSFRGGLIYADNVFKTRRYIMYSKVINSKVKKVVDYLAAVRSSGRKLTVYEVDNLYSYVEVSCVANFDFSDSSNVNLHDEDFDFDSNDDSNLGEENITYSGDPVSNVGTKCIEKSALINFISIFNCEFKDMPLTISAIGKGINMNRNKVSRLISILKKDGSLTSKRVKGGTKYTILK